MTTMEVKAALDVRVEVPQDLHLDEAFVAEVLTAAANRIEKSGEVSVSLVSDDEIRELNHTYRGLDKPTDVLSFALTEGDDPMPLAQGQLEVLGDIVISLPTAMRQADAYGHSLRREVGFLLVHGFLHLNGYDHQDEASEREMFGIQDEVLSSLGLPRADGQR